MQSLIIGSSSPLMRNEMLQHKTGPKCKNFRKNTSFLDEPHYNEDSFVQSWVLPTQQALVGTGVHSRQVTCPKSLYSPEETRQPFSIISF